MRSLVPRTAVFIEYIRRRNLAQFIRSGKPQKRLQSAASTKNPKELDAVILPHIAENICT